MEDVDTFIIIVIYVCIGKCDSLWLCYMALRVTLTVLDSQ